MKTIKLTEGGVETEYILTERRPIIQCLTCGKTQYPCNHEEDKPKFEVWKPKVGNATYEINCFGEVFKSMIYKNQSLYTAFKTESEAIEAHEKALFNYEVEMFIKEKNEGWEPYFEPLKIAEVYYLCECFNDKKAAVHQETNLCVRHVGKNKLFKSWEIGEEILAKFDNDKLLKWWI